MRVHSAKELGMLAANRRHELGLTQQALATRAGVTRQWVMSLESGRVRLEVGLVIRALHALGLGLSARPLAEATPSPVETGAGIVAERASYRASPDVLRAPTAGVARSIRKRR